MDKVCRFHQHYAAVTCPSEIRLHIRHHHVERLAVLAAKDMRVAHTLGIGYGIRLDDRQSLIKQGIVVAVIAQRIANLLLFRSVSCKICEEKRYFLLCCGRHNAQCHSNG